MTETKADWTALKNKRLLVKHYTGALIEGYVSEVAKAGLVKFAGNWYEPHALAVVEVLDA